MVRNRQSAAVIHAGCMPIQVLAQNFAAEGANSGVIGEGRIHLAISEE